MGPLQGVRVVELAGIGPAPFCGMLLADMGADVIRVDRTNLIQVPNDPLNRGRRSIAINLKTPGAAELILKLVESAHILIEGFRPGVAERLGLGPAPCLARNPKLVYGRMTGWGQSGPLSARAGHDLNYIAVSGALHAIGPADGPPSIPLNLVGDFGGGAMFLATGVLAALWHAQSGGSGQVVDAAMVDGAVSLTAMAHGMMAQGLWTAQRGANLLDGRAPFYRVYRTADAEYMAVGAIEPKFYAELLRGLELDPASLPAQYDQSQWDELQRRFEEVFLGRSRAEWAEIFEDRDACVYPVMSLSEAVSHRHNQARETFVDVGGVIQPAPAPRFALTPSKVGAPARRPGQDSDSILEELGLTTAEVARLRDAGILS